MSDREQFENLREAFCARHRCKPEAFVRKAFGKSLSMRSKLLVMLVGGAGDPRFAHDLEVIQSLSNCTVFNDNCSSPLTTIKIPHSARLVAGPRALGGGA
jgi:hypothetical protein